MSLTIRFRDLKPFLDGLKLKIILKNSRGNHLVFFNTFSRIWFWLLLSAIFIVLHLLYVCTWWVHPRFQIVFHFFYLTPFLFLLSTRSLCLAYIGINSSKYYLNIARWWVYYENFKFFPEKLFKVIKLLQKFTFY